MQLQLTTAVAFVKAFKVFNAFIILEPAPRFASFAPQPARPALHHECFLVAADLVQAIRGGRLERPTG